MNNFWIDLIARDIQDQVNHFKLNYCVYLIIKTPQQYQYVFNAIGRQIKLKLYMANEAFWIMQLQNLLKLTQHIFKSSGKWCPQLCFKAIIVAIVTSKL